MRRAPGLVVSWLIYMGKSKGQRGPHFLDFNEKILFHAPVKNCGNSPQSALDDHQNQSQDIINSVRGESGKQENSPVSVFPQLLCTPRTSAWPPPTCPASSRERPSCSPRRARRDVAVPVGTRSLPRRCGAALPPRGSKWSTEVMKHGEPQLRPHGSWKGKNKPTKATIFGL